MRRVYVAPVRLPFDVLHIAEPGWHRHARVDGLTLCGLVIPAGGDELWLPFKLGPHDRVCRDCLADSRGDAARELTLAQ